MRISVPMLRELELHDLATVLGPPESPVEATLVLFGGSFEGGVLLALTEEDGRQLRESLGLAHEEELAVERILSSVLESFVASSAMFLLAELETRLKRRLCDMAGSLVPSLLGELDYEIDSLWLAEVDMLPDGGERILARLFFLGDARFYELIEEMAG
ncbi:MAG: hypothetical protein Kow00129_15580 [Thermoleophilia bacterium]